MLDTVMAVTNCLILVAGSYTGIPPCRRELKHRQAEIAARIEHHHQGDGEYRTTLESLISLASRAAELFERSKAEQKRQLIAFVFSTAMKTPKSPSALRREDNAK